MRRRDPATVSANDIKVFRQAVWFSLVAIGLFVAVGVYGVLSNYDVMIIPLGALASLTVGALAYFFLDDSFSRSRR